MNADKRRFILLSAILLVLPQSSDAGALFEDYLNYVRPGIGTGPGPARAISAPGHIIGQTFTLPARASEIYRIGVRPAYETWTSGQRVTMTLYDSTGKRFKLGEYSIDQASSHVQPVHVERGKETDRVLYFQFRAPTQGRLNFYFEINVVGGNGIVAFQGFEQDKLSVAQAFPDKGRIKDLSFECDIKPFADREANLEAFFTQRLDLSRPDLTAVKTAVDKRDWDKAIAETVRHFDHRGDLWDRWLVFIRNPRQDADRRLPDLLLQNMLLHEETHQPVPWRPESYWTPEYATDRKQESKTVAPSPYTWHFDRTLGRAFFETKQEKYARKAIDLRMQFIMDNPSPRTSGLPWYFELWNDRTAAARAPGFGIWAYTYFHNYPGFTNDERLVFLSFFEDNARWDYKSTSGANWGAEAARACYEFGVLFPEWKMSKEYVDWGTHRLAEIVLQDVRGDGTSIEAAIKYHAMVARRLKAMLEDHFAGKIQLEPALLERLLKSTASMYEVMAYTLQPNDVVVMCGDSWNENYAYAGEVKQEDVTDPKRLVARLKDAADPLSAWIAGQFSSELRKRLSEAAPGTTPPPELMGELLGAINKIVNPARNHESDARPEPIYAADRFAGVTLSPLTQRLLQVRPLSVELEHLNRLLVSDAYADCISPAWKSGELESAAQIVKRPDFTWVASQGRSGQPPAPVSKVFPDGGYFIMRSDFAAPESPHSTFGPTASSYVDSRQLFIHNGPWFGSHGHADLLSLNLYAFGRTLLVDPGQYDYKPPEGIGQYWTSSVHSMLVMDGKDTGRNPGPSEWTSNSLIDYFDGIHQGYKHTRVRRRVAFIKPDYFIVDDSAAPDENESKAKTEHDWAQVWNLNDPQARVDEATRTIQTTFPSGGNVLIESQNPEALTAEVVPGLRDVAGSKNHAPTRIVRLHQKTAVPRFTTLLVPYDGGVSPHIQWRSNDRTRVRWLEVESARGKDWLVLGHAGDKSVFTYGPGEWSVDADFAAVLSDGRFCWSDGKELQRGAILARAGQRVHSLTVCQVGSVLQVEVSEAEPTLAIRVPSTETTAKKSASPTSAAAPLTIVLNGQEVRQPVIRDGMYYPFADQPVTIVADDRDAFEPITQTGEWTRTADPRSWQTGYTQQETDPGRHESGRFTLIVPEAGKFALDVYIPQTSLPASDRIDYVFRAEGVVADTKPPLLGHGRVNETYVDALRQKNISGTRGISSIVEWLKPGGNLIVTLDQQAARGWINLGEFDFPSGQFSVVMINQTPTDGLYLIADAIRLVKR